MPRKIRLGFNCRVVWLNDRPDIPQKNNKRAKRVARKTLGVRSILGR